MLLTYPCRVISFLAGLLASCGRGAFADHIRAGSFCLPVQDSLHADRVNAEDYSWPLGISQHA